MTPKSSVPQSTGLNATQGYVCLGEGWWEEGGDSAQMHVRENMNVHGLKLSITEWLLGSYLLFGILPISFLSMNTDILVGHS